jgi:hypothetical protein
MRLAVTGSGDDEARSAAPASRWQQHAHEKQPCSAWLHQDNGADHDRGCDDAEGEEEQQLER